MIYEVINIFGLSPYPVSNEVIEQDEYRILMIIKKLESGSWFLQEKMLNEYF